MELDSIDFVISYLEIATNKDNVANTYYANSVEDGKM